jgi:voltage-gated potassium channel
MDVFCHRDVPAMDMKIKRMQLRCYQLLEPGIGNDTASKFLDRFLSLMILFAVSCSVLETMPELAPYSSYFRDADLVCVAIFTFEFLARLWTAPCKSGSASPNKKRYIYLFSFYGLVDLAAILPFYFATLLPGVNLAVLRVVRVMRILKLSHYNSALQDLWEAIYDERKAFISSIYILAIALLLTSSGMYYAEHAVQPEEFSSIPHAMWWSIITLTTVGYGDVSPVTALGKIIGAATAVLGVCTLALLTGIVANSFAAQMSRRRAIFEVAVRKALEDGKLSSQERQVLDQLRDEFNLTREHADAIFQNCVSESAFPNLKRSG